MKQQQSTSLAYDLKLTCLVTCCGALNGFSIAKLAPAIDILTQTYHLSFSQIGFLASMTGILMVLTGACIGSIVQSVGRKRVLLCALLLLCLANVISLVEQSIVSIFIGRAIEGISFITVTLTAPALLSSYTHPKRRGLIMGIWGTFMPLGNVCAILIVPWMLQMGSWQAAWATGLVLSSIVGLFAWKIIPDDLVKFHLVMDHKAITQAITMPMLAYIGICFSAHTVIYQTLLQFLSLFLQTSGGFDIRFAFSTTILFCLVHLLGNITGGHVLQKGLPPWAMIAMVFMAMAILLLLLVMFSLPMDGLFIIFLAIGFVSGASPVAYFYLLSNVDTSTIKMPIFTGWVLQLQSAGMLIGPSCFSVIVEQFDSWEAGFASLALVGVMIALLAYSLHIKYKPKTV